MVNIIRVSLYNKRPKSLRVKFDYNEITVRKVKSIPGREYIYKDKLWIIPYKYIRRLTDMFNESDIILDEGVDINYEETDNYDFTKEIDLFKIDQFRTFARYVLKHAPEYFFVSPAVQSSSKYYPVYTLTDEGLVNHTIATMKLADSLSLIHKLTDEEHDILLIAALMHDFFKFGTENNIADGYALFEHPLLCVNIFNDIFKEEYEVLDTSIKYVYNKHWKEIAACIKSHKGQWNTTENSDIKLPLPTTKLQKILHECNFLASRNYINIKVR